MKSTFVLAAACFFLLTGCGAEAADSSNDLGSVSAITVDVVKNAEEPADSKVDFEITEKVFVSGINDIFINTDDYLGKTIKYEGIFNTVEENGETYCSVFRNSPGCCGADGVAGFEVQWDGNYPNKNDWVEAVGVLDSYDKDGQSYLRLNLSSLKVLPERGAEFVS